MYEKPSRHAQPHTNHKPVFAEIADLVAITINRKASNLQQKKNNNKSVGASKFRKKVQVLVSYKISIIISRLTKRY